MAGEAVTYAFEQLQSAPLPLGAVDDVLSAAAREAEEIRARARAAGEAEGRAHGLQLIQAEAAPALNALRGAAASVEGLANELLDQLEHDAVELALRLAEQIVQGAIAADPALVVGVARTALRRIADRRRVTLIVNPADLDLLGDAVPDLQHELGGIEHLAVHADRRVGRGGAIARTDAGEIDASIEAQLLSAR
jgi:flagellar assembly protein FliH